MKLLGLTSPNAPAVRIGSASLSSSSSSSNTFENRGRGRRRGRAIHNASARSGIALIIVMICVTVLTGMALAFARLMHVENKLAANANADANFYPVARGAVDWCISALSASASCPDEVWEGRLKSSCSNSIVEGFRYDEVTESGRFTWEIHDLDRKANINRADLPMLEKAMTLLGVDPGDSGPISASILDWISRDPNASIGGTESRYYETLDPPIKAKDGYMDDISELLLVRGVTRQMYDGGGEQIAPPPPSAVGDQVGFAEAPVQRTVLTNLFTPISSGQININTASAEVLQLVPFIDENIAQRIIACRTGEDTGQPTPFRNPGEALLCAGMNPQIVGQIQNRFAVRSSMFEVHIVAEINHVIRHYYAILYRRSPRDIQLLTFYWKLNAPASHADAR